MSKLKKKIFSIGETEINELEDILGVKFKNKNTLLMALTHKSYANETGDTSFNNERLEFLGDSILSLVINEYLYKKYKDNSEGMLSKIKGNLVSSDTLYEIAFYLDLGKYIQLGRGEDSSGGRGRKNLLEDVFEAIVAAIYLDRGFLASKKFILSVFSYKFIQINDGTIHKDYKTALQEMTQKHYKSTPTYIITNMVGPEHNKIFTTEVLIADKIVGSGSGFSKKEAEQDAAKNAIEILKEKQVK